MVKIVFKVFSKLFDLLGKFHGFLQKSDLQAYFRIQVNICYKCAIRHGVACTNTLYREHFFCSWVGIDAIMVEKSVLFH